MAKRADSAQRRMYQDFADYFTSCWACGWSAHTTLRRCEIAHIVGGAGRSHDRRNIVRLCSLCHRLAHGDRIVRGELPLPTLSISNLLWLKRENDEEWYDVAYLQSLRVKRCEPLEALELPGWFEECRRMRGVQW